jgi:hypothetical protein
VFYHLLDEAFEQKAVEANRANKPIEKRLTNLGPLIDK